MAQPENYSTHRVLLGVTGGIAAYKSADLVRRLAERGAEVRVVMTEGAQAFVTPLTFQAVSGNPVHTTLLDEDAEAGMGHIELARWAQTILVAPATADFMARLASGMADDLLSTLCLASEAPVVLAPAMNRQMWANVATRENADALAARGVRFLGPDEGGQACGEVGQGRMMEPLDIARALLPDEPAVLAGKTVVVTAGPTYEDIDPVRFIGNRSSGKMGFAVAAAAARAGAKVQLVAGPCGLDTPAGVERTDVRGAREMHDMAVPLAQQADVFIAVAAVADYTPTTSEDHKIKKGADSLTLRLEPTPDIVSAVAALDNRPYTVGFAAETQNLEEYARGKLSRKGLDMIAANRVGLPGSGFESENNEIWVYTPTGEKHLGQGSKVSLAHKLIGEIASALDRS